jgi:hypothetical protein
MRGTILVSAFLCGMGLVGCGGSSTSTPTAGEATGAAATQAAAAPASKAVAVRASAKPEQVVSVFLDALRGGDQATTAALLTAKALTETSQRELSVCPQATPNMQYTINHSQVLPENPNGAHVNVTWTENYADGTVSYDVVWVLRKQQEGWRVAGMAIELVPGQGLAFLNFEDPDDMIRKQEEAMAALSPPAAETAALPVDNTGVVPTEFQQPPGANQTEIPQGQLQPAPGQFQPSAGSQFVPEGINPAVPAGNRIER